MQQTQQTYLKEAKAELEFLLGYEVTWDSFAELCSIKSRAFKTYRMPDDSKDYRGMSDLAKKAVDDLLSEHRKKAARRKKK